MAKIVPFIKREWPFFALALFGLVLKLWQLDARPLHHDESLHAQYGKYFADSFTRGFYKYDPLLHGPLLYHLQGLWHWLAAPLSNAGVRFISVLLGFFLSLSPLLFRHKFSRSGLLFASLFLALSPTFTYWSRFLRHDYLAIAAILLGAWSWIVRPKHWVTWLGIAAGLHFSIKENFFVHLALICGFLVTEFIVTKKSRLPNLKQIGIFALAFLITSYPLYTGWFQYPSGFLDGLYRKSLFYWLEQHHVERIKGPFFYKTLIMTIYETWMIPVFLLLGFYWIKKQKTIWRFVDLSILLVLIAIAWLLSHPAPNFFVTWFKIKNGLDFFIFFSLIYMALRTTLSFLQQQRIELAFYSYLFFASFFTYSFLGEKVPWLAIYPTLAAVILVGRLFSHFSVKTKAFCFLTLILCLPKTIYINHIVPGDARELISQVHTNEKYEAALVKIQKALETPPGHIKPRVLVLEENGWPLSWFLWGRNGVEYGAKNKIFSDYDFIFDKLLNHELSQQIASTHTRVILPMRHYWWPNFDDITFKRWLDLVLFHRPWSMTGDFKISLWKKKNGFFSE